MFLETTVRGELPTVYFYVLPNSSSNPVESWLSSSFSWWQALFRYQHSCLFPAMTLRPLVPRLGCAPETQNMKVNCDTGLPCWFKFFSSVDRIAQSFCREKHILDTHTHTPTHPIPLKLSLQKMCCLVYKLPKNETSGELWREEKKGGWCFGTSFMKNTLSLGMNLTKSWFGLHFTAGNGLFSISFSEGLLPPSLYTEGHKGRCELGARRADSTDL